MAIRRFSNSSITTGTKSSKLIGISSQPDIGAFESIATAVVDNSGSVSTVSFTNIPKTYSHLQIRWHGKETSNGTSNWFGLQGYFNGDTTNVYTNHYLGTYAVTGGGAQTNFADSSLSNGFINLSILGRGNGDNVTYGSGVIEILEYASTTKFKTIRSLSGFVFNPTPNRLDIMSGCWRSYNPIESIDLSAPGNYAVGTTFSLYGIRGN